MARYYTKRRAQWVEDDESLGYPHDHIPTVSDHEAVDTGLLDINGDPIFRAPNPMGFVWN